MSGKVGNGMEWVHLEAWSQDIAAGLNTFINGVKDIKIVINSYGYSGN